MIRKSNLQYCGWLCAALMAVCWNPMTAAQDSKHASSLTLLVMDPMSAPLACDCVAGYAQRKYEFLGQFLSKQVSRDVKVYWAQSIKAGMQEAHCAPT